MQPLPARRAYVNSHFAFELHGDDRPSFVSAVDGGHLKSEVITSQYGDSQAHFRYLGRPKFEDISLTVGLGMGKDFYDWISQSFAGKSGAPPCKDGSIAFADFDYKVTMRRDFHRAYIHEVTLPAADATSKEAAYMTVKITPEWIRYKEGGDEHLSPSMDMQEKRWLPSMFRFELDKFDKGVMRRVSKVDPISIKQNVILSYYGDDQEDIGHLSPGKLDLPNISFTIPEMVAAPFFDWWHQTIVNAKESEQRTHGALHFLDGAGKELLSASFDGALISGITVDKADAKSPAVKNVKVDLSVESFSFSWEGK